MSTQHITASIARPRGSSLALAAVLAAACVTDATSTPAETEPPLLGAAAMASPGPASAVPVAAPEPIAPPAPNAEPATPRLAFHGRCLHIGSSTVDGHTFVHYRDDNGGFVHRMDEHGAIAQTLPFMARDQSYGGHRTIDGIMGHWPAQLVLLETYHERADDYGYLYRFTENDWKQIAPIGSTSSYRSAWGWHSGSILAWARVEKDLDRVMYGLDRLVVVRGEPKAPALAKLERRMGCKVEQFGVADVAVTDERVSVLAHCTKRFPGGKWSTDWWVGTWVGDDPEGTATRLPKDVQVSRLYLDDQGDGFIAKLFDAEPTLLRWSGGTASALVLAGPRLDAVIQARDGRAWIVQGSMLSRFTGEGWEPLPIPEGPPIEEATGLEHGTPWLLRKGGALSMQAADGTWHDVVLPPTPELGTTPEIDGVRVVAPGDAWVQAEYSVTVPAKKTGRPDTKELMQALYTTRDAPVPTQCG